jgi:hypothetical protein
MMLNKTVYTRVLYMVAKETGEHNEINTNACKQVQIPVSPELLNSKHFPSV